MAIREETVQRKECDRCDRRIGKRIAKQLEAGAFKDAREMFATARGDDPDKALPDLCPICGKAVSALTARIIKPTVRPRKEKREKGGKKGKK